MTGVYTTMTRDDRLVDVEFVSSAGLIIAEDSIENSMSFNVDIDAVEQEPSRPETDNEQDATLSEKVSINYDIVSEEEIDDEET